MRVYKYPLRSLVNRDEESFDDIRMPQRAKMLSAVVVDGQGVIYALVPESEPLTTRRIYVIGTGKQAPESEFISTLVDETLDFVYVWHIFDGGEV